MSTPQIALTGEHADLRAMLQTQRALLRRTVRDLTDEQAARRTTVSALCLGGIVKHVTETERTWYDFAVDGPAAPGHDEARAANWQDGFRMLPGETLAGLLDRYGEVARATDDLLATQPDLEVARPLPPAPWFEPGTAWTVRQALLHILMETAQHAGHADILRECLDGAKSMS